jgi:hypothetical protein
MRSRPQRREGMALSVHLAICLAVAALLAACGGGDGAEVGTPRPPSRQTAPATEPGTQQLQLENVRKPVEAKDPDAAWTYLFEVTGAQTSVHGRFRVAPPGQAYVKVFLRAKNVATDRPAPLNDGATPSVELARRLGPQEECSPGAYYLAGNGQFCLERTVARQYPYNSDGVFPYELAPPNDSEEYYRVGSTWRNRYDSGGAQIPPGGWGEILVEGGPYPEPLEGRDFYVFITLGDAEIPLAGG